jgi:S1-C subfamily serine protease
MLFPRVPNVQIVPPGSERNPSRGVGFQGVQVIEVVKDSPAEKAGIQVGDVILAVDAQNVDTTHPLDQLIGAKKPNDTVQLKIQRGTDTKTISVTLGANPNNASTAYLGIRFAPRLMPMPQSNGG